MTPVTHSNGSHSLPAPRPPTRSPPKSHSRLRHDLSFLAPGGGSHRVPRAEEAAGLKAAGEAAALPRQDARIGTDARTHAVQPVMSGHSPGPGPAPGKDRPKLSF